MIPTVGPTPYPSSNPTPWPSSAPTLVPSAAEVVKSYHTNISSAEIGYIIIGIVVFCACIVCCLAAIGFNSKRRKRARDQASWEDVAHGRLSLQEQNYYANNASQVDLDDGHGHDEGFYESMFSGGGRSTDFRDAHEDTSENTISKYQTTLADFLEHPKDGKETPSLHDSDKKLEWHSLKASTTDTSIDPQVVNIGSSPFSFIGDVMFATARLETDENSVQQQVTLTAQERNNGAELGNDSDDNEFHF